MTEADLFKTAVKKAKAGERQEARALLLELVKNQPSHELAWLWLSQLVEDPEDKIIALENALTINPQRSEARSRLEKLQEQYGRNRPPIEDHFSHNGAASPLVLTEEESEFAAIEALFAQGETNKARHDLAAFLRRYSNHEAGWWLMVQHADSQANLLTALDHLLRLNAQHPQAPEYLGRIRPTNEQYLQMGRLFERLERWETAVSYYKRALKSPNNADRLLAQKRLPHVQEQVKLDKIKVTSPTATVLRLAAGPTLLYAMLVLVQAGLNPLHAAPTLCLGNLAFLAGMLLISGLSYAPDHRWLRQLRETAVFQNKTTLRALSIALVLLPILLLLLMSLERLSAFHLDLTGT